MDAGDSAFFAWEIGWTVHALEDRPRAAAAREHLPSAALHARDGRAGPRHDRCSCCRSPLFTRRRGAALQRRPAADVPVLGAHGLLAGAGAGRAGGGRAPRRGALRLLADPHRPGVAHLSTLGTQWWPLVLLFTIRFARRGRTRDALLAALFFVLAFLACGYHGVIAVGGAAAVRSLVLFWGRWDRLKAGALAAVLAGLALLPVYLMHQKALAPERYARGDGGDDPVLGAGRVVPLDERAGTGSTARRPTPSGPSGPNNLFPGLVVPGARAGRRDRAARGAGSGRAARPWRSPCCSLAPALVALGPRVRAFGHDLGPGPWALLRDTLPRLPDDPRDEPGRRLPRAAARRCSRRWRSTRLGRGRVVLGGRRAASRSPRRSSPRSRCRSGASSIDTRKEPPPVYRWLAEQPGRDPIVAPADARRVRAREAAGVPRERLHGLLDAALEAARERLRGDRAAARTCELRELLARRSRPRSSWRRCARSARGT